MSSTSKCCTASRVVQVVAGVLVVAGVATLTWKLLARQRDIVVDPLAEADRRIDMLEESLRHLQDNFSQAVGV